MKPSGLYILLTALVVFLLIFNSLMSKDIHEWIPSLKEKIFLYLLVWLLPLIGLLLANKIGKLGWFSKKNSSGDGSSISGGILGLDEIFNPSTKHVIEVIEEHKAGIHEEQRQSDDKDKNMSKYP